MKRTANCWRKHRLSKNRRAGFTLMEVILSLAILAVGMLVLNGALRLAQQCGRTARDLTYAQMLCEEKMNEISSGLLSAQPAADVAFEKYAGWLYTVETGDLDMPGLTAVSVTVTQDLPPERDPAIYTMVRWVGDPASDAAQSSDSTNSSNSTNSQNSSSSNGSSSGSTNSSGSGSSGGTSK